MFFVYLVAVLPFVFRTDGMLSLFSSMAYAEVFMQENACFLYWTPQKKKNGGAGLAVLLHCRYMWTCSINRSNRILDNAFLLHLKNM